MSPASPAFDASYDGARVPGCSAAIELMNTSEAPARRRGRAARAIRKCARRFTANASSQAAASVPARRAPRAMPTFSTTPSSPPSAGVRLRDDPLAGCRRRRRRPPRPRRARPPSRCASSVVARGVARPRPRRRPRRPRARHSSAIARPLPIGASGSGLGRVPAPTTRILRPTQPRAPGGEAERLGGQRCRAFARGGGCRSLRHHTAAID